ncbi:aminoglycoside phosphotransferase family protein [Thiotrichales bacterium 19S3-7]|nr:aminoglycoside phosphotransferase family protein [Thiotrichales bacterium 19S3-7]MCF6802604.1 aminoglycoside phosphotransferase family protein [Thiotrichales bacterium 19S3-11]
MIRQQALQWAKSYLKQQGESVVFEESITNSPWASVSKLVTNKRELFLKQTPTDLYCEVAVLRLLNKLEVTSIPQLVAENHSLNAFLTSSVGEVSLREISDRRLMMGLFIKGVISYAQLQRYFEDKLFLLEKVGVKDYTLDNFPALYHHLLNQQSQLLADGLLAHEYKKLQQLTTKLIELSNKLKAYQIPETLIHCDFHDGNLIFDSKTMAVSIIDWGEVALSHPFFSLAGCLWNLVYQRNLDKQSKMYYKLKLELLRPWLDLYDQKHLMRAFDLAEKLNGFYAALGYQFIYMATKNEVLPASVYKKGALSGCLRSFINVLCEKN